MCTSVCVITSPSAPTCAQLLSLPYTQARAVSCPREDWETLGTCALQKVDLEVSTQYEKPQPRERPRAALCPQAPRVGSTGLGARSRDRAPEPRCNGSRREGAENGTGATSGLHGLLSPDPSAPAPSPPHRRPGSRPSRPEEGRGTEGGTLLGQKRLRVLPSPVRETSARDRTPPRPLLPSTRESAQWLPRRLENIGSERFKNL